MVIGIVPEIQENYFNVERLWLEMSIDKLSRSFTIPTDLKLRNILLGLMSHSSQHPCCWCNVGKGNLSARGITRTVANMMDLFWDYFDARADKKKAKDFGNVIHPNMFVGGTVNESAPIILLVPPPELHLLMGPVNTLYVQLLKISPDCERWSKQLHLKREDCHGGLFNGQ